MRSVKAQAQAVRASRARRHARQGEVADAVARARLRGGEPDSRHGYGEALRARFGRFGSAVLFRRPMLTLTVLLVVCAADSWGSSPAVMLSRARRQASRCRHGASAGFARRRVSVSPAAERTSAADVVCGARRRAAASPSSPSMLPRSRARLLELPWVADAEVAPQPARRDLRSG